jgi:hypothetical protein
VSRVPVAGRPAGQAVAQGGSLNIVSFPTVEEDGSIVRD